MSWDCTRPIRELPTAVSHVFQYGAKYFHGDLAENRLKVTLINAPDPHFTGHMIRQVESMNPRWYSDLYHSVAHLKRTRSLRSLERIMFGRDLPYVEQRGAVHPWGGYDTLYRQLIQDCLTAGINEMTMVEWPLEKTSNYPIVRLPWPRDEDDEVPF